MKGPHFHNVQINLIHTLFTGDMLLDEPDYERAVPVRISRADKINAALLIHWFIRNYD